jgi:hypothetical protein
MSRRGTSQRECGSKSKACSTCRSSANRHPNEAVPSPRAVAGSKDPAAMPISAAMSAKGKA